MSRSLTELTNKEYKQMVKKAKTEAENISYKDIVYITTSKTLPMGFCRYVTNEKLIFDDLGNAVASKLPKPAMFFILGQHSELLKWNKAKEMMVNNQYAEILRNICKVSALGFSPAMISTNEEVDEELKTLKEMSDYNK